MRLNRPSPARSAAMTRLLLLATQWAKSSSRPEDAYYEAQLAQAVDTILASGKDTVLMSALDDLWQEDPRAYDLLADFVEDRIQSARVAGEPTALLILIPVLAWSRNELPAGKTDPELIEALKAALHTHCLAPGVSLQLSHKLYTPDSLPQGFAETNKLAKTLFDAGKLGEDVLPKRYGRFDGESYYLADCRFWAGVLRAPAGAPLFQWQLNPETSAHTSQTNSQTSHTLKQAWNAAAQTAIAPMLIGCGYEVLPPAAFYSACRSGESEIRGFSLKASAHMIMSSLDIGPDDLKAVVGACWGTSFEEYRVSLLTRNGDTVLQGVSWPLLGHEESPEQILKDIMNVLAELDIQRVRMIEEQLPMEFCEDCGTPLFPDPSAEMVHTGPPDEEDEGTPSLIVH